MNIVFNTCALVSVHLKNLSIHLGVYKADYSVYQNVNGKQVFVECERVWGRAVDEYDSCIDYFGLGPFLLLCWPHPAFRKE